MSDLQKKGEGGRSTDRPLSSYQRGARRAGTVEQNRRLLAELDLCTRSPMEVHRTDTNSRRKDSRS
jgi:hypothetical protein